MIKQHQFTIERQDQKHLFTLYEGNKLICRNLSRAQLLKVLKDFTRTQNNKKKAFGLGRLLLIAALLYTLVGVGTAKADEYTYLSQWEHLGVSYAIQTFTYGAVKTALPSLTRTECLLLSGIITFSVTTTYEFTKQSGSSGSNILMNVLGQGASIGTVYVFSF